MSGFRGFLCLTAALFWPLASPIQAQDPCAPFTGGSTLGVNQIQLNAIGHGRSPDTGALNGAASMWNSCHGVPNFSTSAGDYSVTVHFWQGANDGTNVPNCGTECGCAPSGVVHVFEMNANGSRDCTQGWDSLIAHELGHELGLANAQSGCSGCRIMGNTACGPSVQAGDCAAVDPWWYVSTEDGYTPPPDGHPCSNPRV